MQLLIFCKNSQVFTNNWLHKGWNPLQKLQKCRNKDNEEGLGEYN